jgi:hypothetical protein
MWADAGLLALGALCAGLGGELLVRGAIRAAAWLRLTPRLIGATVAALIHPIAARLGEVAVALGFGLVAVLAALPYRARAPGPRRGVFLLALYAAYAGGRLLAA